MPATEYVIGLECDLSNIDDVAAQEAVQEFARALVDDNEHNRALEHIIHLLGGRASQVSANAALDGEYGRYLASISHGCVERTKVDGLEAQARFDRLAKIGIHVVNPQRELRGRDPMLFGRLRQKLDAIDQADGDDHLERMLRALTHPAHAIGQPDGAEIRRHIYSALTQIRDPRAVEALLHALATDVDTAIKPVIPQLVRQRGLLQQLPALLAKTWGHEHQVASRLLDLVPDMELSAEWRAAAPPDLVAQIERSRPQPAAAPTDVAVDAPVQSELLAALTAKDVRVQSQALREVARKRSPMHVPTLLAVLSHSSTAGTMKSRMHFRSEVYSLLSFHEAQPVRDALLAALASETDEVVNTIIYVAWRQELLLARLPTIVADAWHAPTRNERYVDRLIQLWVSHREHVTPPTDWYRQAPEELQHRTASLFARPKR